MQFPLRFQQPEGENKNFKKVELSFLTPPLYVDFFILIIVK